MKHLWIYANHLWIICEATQTIDESFMNPEQPPRKIKNLNGFLRWPARAQGIDLDQTWACIGHLWFRYESIQIIYGSYMNLYKPFINHVGILSSTQTTDHIQTWPAWFIYESVQVIYESYMNLYKPFMNHIWILSIHQSCSVNSRCTHHRYISKATHNHSKHIAQTSRKNIWKNVCRKWPQPILLISHPFLFSFSYDIIL